jgi:ATP-dependent protease ClpP protease subunit
MGNMNAPDSPPANVQHIWCSAIISKKMEDVFVGFICGQAQNSKNIARYIVYLSTPGGNPFSAVNLYNFIKSLPQETVVYNMGTVSSAGVPVFLAFKERYGVPGCSFMIHQTTTSKTALPEQLSATELRAQAVNLEVTDKRTQAIIEKETRGRGTTPLTPRLVAKMVVKSTTFTDGEAQARGIIDRIEQPTLPKEGIFYLTDQFLATLPGALTPT